ISHEFYTPMNQILGLTDLLLAGEVSEEGRQDLTAVGDSARELLAILENLLDFSQLELGRVRLETGPVRPRELVRDGQARWGLGAEQKGLRLTAEVCPRVPEVIRADGNQLRRVLLQVVGNGIKFTEEGEVSVRVSPMGENETRMN